MRLELVIIIEIFLCQQTAPHNASTIEKHYRGRGKSFNGTLPAELFRGRRLDVDASFGYPAQPGNAMPHSAVIRRQLGLLRNNGHVRIDDFKPFSPHDGESPLEQFTACDVFVASVIIREMRADIALAEGAENGIDESVEHGVGIGMSRQPARVRNRNAAENEFPPALEAVHVKTMSDANRHRRFAFRIQAS